MGAGSSKPNSSENKMVGTISNKIAGMSKKEKYKRDQLRYRNMTQSEIDICKKYGTWNEIRKRM